jgi:hypothetical protein
VRIKLTAALLPVLLLMIMFSGCAAKSATHPNQLNSFDGSAYDTLITAQAALESAKAQINVYPEAKPILNEAIASYNVALASYKAYHNAGGGDISQLQAQLIDVVKAVANVQKAFGVTL